MKVKHYITNETLLPITLNNIYENPRMIIKETKILQVNPQKYLVLVIYKDNKIILTMEKVMNWIKKISKTKI